MYYYISFYIIIFILVLSNIVNIFTIVFNDIVALICC